MEVLDWLNENAFRGFPLLEESPRTFSDAVFLDLQLVLSSALSDAVLLKSIRKEATDIQVTFGTFITDVASFTITNYATATYPYYHRLSGGSLLVVGEELKSYAASLTLNATTTLNIQVEPTTCYVFSDAWLGVSGLTVEHNKQTVTDTLSPVLPLVSAGNTTLTGDVTLAEGFNFRVNTLGGKINLEIASGAGERVHCTTQFLPSQYLDCGELVSYINGVGPDAAGVFDLRGGDSVNISTGKTLSPFSDQYAEDANEDTVFVGLTFAASDICKPVKLKPSVL